MFENAVTVSFESPNLLSLNLAKAFILFVFLLLKTFLVNETFEDKKGLSFDTGSFSALFALRTDPKPGETRVKNFELFVFQTLQRRSWMSPWLRNFDRKSQMGVFQQWQVKFHKCPETLRILNPVVERNPTTKTQCQHYPIKGRIWNLGTWKWQIFVYWRFWSGKHLLGNFVF